MAFQASTVAHSKAAGSWIKTDGFAFLPDQYRLGSVSTGKPHVRPQVLPRCMPSGGTPRTVRKHTPVVSSLKRRFCDNGTKLCLPLLAAAYSFRNRLTKRSSSRKSARTPSSICSACSVAAASLSATIGITGAISRSSAS
jgi:hypothetical protein